MRPNVALKRNKNKQIIKLGAVLKANNMANLQQLLNARRQQMANALSGLNGLKQHIAELERMPYEQRALRIEQLKGYIDALFDNHLISLQDANDWRWIVASKA